MVKGGGDAVGVAWLGERFEACLWDERGRGGRELFFFFFLFLSFSSFRYILGFTRAFFVCQLKPFNGVIRRDGYLSFHDISLIFAPS